MANTTFNGPVRSQNGFQTISVNSSTGAVTTTSTIGPATSVDSVSATGNVTADNDINALKSMNSIPEGYTVNHYLSDTNAWFLLTDVPNGLKHFVRTPMQTSMDADFDTGNARYKARERYSFGVSDPLGAYGSPGA